MVLSAATIDVVCGWHNRGARFLFIFSGGAFLGSSACREIRYLKNISGRLYLCLILGFRQSMENGFRFFQLVRNLCSPYWPMQCLRGQKKVQTKRKPEEQGCTHTQPKAHPCDAPCGYGVVSAGRMFTSVAHPFSQLCLQVPERYVGSVVWGQKASEKKHQRQGLFGFKMSYLCVHLFLSLLKKTAHGLIKIVNLVSRGESE